MLCKLVQGRLQGYPRPTNPRRALRTQRKKKPARCTLKIARNAKVQKWCADAGKWREDHLARCAEGAGRNGRNLPRRTHGSGQGGLPSFLVSLHSACDTRHAPCCMLNTLAFHDTHYHTAHSTSRRRDSMRHATCDLRHAHCTRHTLPHYTLYMTQTRLKMVIGMQIRISNGSLGFYSNVSCEQNF